MATVESSQRTILVVMVGSAAITMTARMVAGGSDRIRRPGNTVRIVAGTTLGTILLMVVAKAEPDMAQLFALLVLMGTVYTYGMPVLAKVTKPLQSDFKVMSVEEYKKAKTKGKNK